MTTYPQITINGINPFYLVQSADTLFDQTHLSEHERFLPLYRFQKTILILAALYRFIKVAAPSQSGKTTTAELLGALMAYAYPGDNTLILSTRQEQSERLLRDIRNKLIKRCRVPELQKLSRDSSTILEIEQSRSQIIALPHSINALTGNPARVVILDEMEKWDKEPAKIYAEAVARTGKTGGQVIVISSVDAEGHRDNKSPEGYRGSFFHYTWQETFKDRRNPNKDAVAARFTYHTSPHLAQSKNIEALKKEMEAQGPGYFEAHYLCIPRKVKGRAVFENDFKKDIHIKSDSDLANKLNPYEFLFVSFDPGLYKACVVGQLDPDAPRLIYLRAYLADREQTFEAFVKSCYIKVKKEFASYDILLFSDIAGKQENRQTGETDIQVIEQIFQGYTVYAEYQHRESLTKTTGIKIMRSFMHQVDGFYVSEKATLIIDALNSGLVNDERGGITLDIYKKDGYWDHIGDAARYPVYSLTGGMLATTLSNSQAFEVSYNPYANPVTGY